MIQLLLDYINRLLYVDYSIIEIKKSMTYFKNELRDVLSKEKPNKKNSDLLENIVSKLKVIYDELSTEYDIRFEKIEKSNLIDEVTLSMLKSYLEKNELLFLKYYDELMKKQHPNKNEGDLKTLSSNNSMKLVYDKIFD